MRERVAPIALQDTDAPLVGDQAALAPIGQQVRPVRDTVAPIQRQATAPVVQTVEPVQRTVAPLQQRVIEPIEQTVAPVRRTVEPVIEPVRQRVRPIVEPVLKPVQNTTDPVLKPINDLKADTVDPVVKPVRDSGGEATGTRPVAHAAPPALTEDPSVAAPKLGGVADRATQASSSSPSSTPALSAQAFEEKMKGSSVEPLAGMAQGVSTVPPNGPANTATSNVSLSENITITPPAHEKPAGGQQVTSMTAAGESSPAALSFLSVGDRTSLSHPSGEYGAAATQSQPLPIPSSLPIGSASGNAPASAASSMGGAPYAGAILVLILFALSGGMSAWYAREFLKPDSVFGLIINQPG